MKRAYYAHCMSIYDTHQEARDIALIQQLGYEVINPNAPATQRACDAMVEARVAKGRVMEEIFRPLVEDADVFVFRALPDGAVSSGVYREWEWAVEAGIPVIELPCPRCRRVRPAYLSERIGHEAAPVPRRGRRDQRA